MRHLKSASLRVGLRLGLAALLFLFPVGYLIWLLSSSQGIAIRFAAKEVDGAGYLRGLLAVEAAADLAALDNAAPPVALLDALRTREGAAELRLGATQAADAAGQAMRGHDRAAALGKLRDLIGLVGDHSNLILDNVLDSY